MRFLVMAILLAKLICCTSPVIDLASTSANCDPILSRSGGISCCPNTSYINAILTAAYSIPSIQEIFYNEAVELINGYSGDPNVILNESVKLAVACKFAVLRLQSKAYPVGDAFFSAFNKEFDFSCQGKSVNIFTFFIKVITSRSLTIRNLFRIDTLSKVVDFETGAVLKRMINESCAINVTVESVSYSISAFIKNQMHYPFESKPIITTKDANGKEMLLRVQREVVNSPPVLVVGVDRLAFHKETKEIRMKTGGVFVDYLIVVNEIQYILVANVEYDTSTKSFSTIALDFETSSYYRYEADGRVSPVEPSPQPDTKSVLLFYVPRKATEEINLNDHKTFKDIPEPLVKMAREFIALYEKSPPIESIQPVVPVRTEPVISDTIPVRVNAEIIAAEKILEKWNSIDCTPLKFKKCLLPLKKCSNQGF